MKPGSWERRKAFSSSPPRDAADGSPSGFENRPRSSPRRSRSSKLSPSASLSFTSPSSFSSSSSSSTLVTQDFVTEFEELQLGPIPSSSDLNPRSFPHRVKQQCWEKAEKVKGRDPDRWRRDPLGNLVFKKFVCCPGCLCHDYDHIVPYSKAD